MTCFSPFLMALVCCILPVFSNSQQLTEYQWIDPVEDDRFEFKGQGWNHDQLASPYDRLPAIAEDLVRKPVWNLSRHTAGVHLTFNSDAQELVVRYQVTGRYDMPHMPATGVSGVDLYVRSPGDDRWLYCKGRYSFGDTISYTFRGLNTRQVNPGKSYQYQLFLPLYNAVKWMEVGLPESATISASTRNESKPIVVYGTSIAQGGCASRPGMAWTSILQRSLDNPVINLAFSGNGRLEPELISLINEIDAGLYVLDCLPNLTNGDTYPEEELKKRIRESVMALRKKHPGIPILLTDHAGYSEDQVTAGSYNAVQRVNNIQRGVFDSMKEEGLDRLYYLGKDEINMCMDCTVDGTHQTDLGMEYYAKAYGKIIRRIMAEIN